MQRKLRFLAAASFSLGLPILALPLMPVAAQQPPIAVAPHGSMESLARQVVASHPEIEAQRQQVRIAKARLQAAESGYLPTIEANGTVQKRQIDVKNGGTGDATFILGQAAVEARLRFYDGDRTFNAVQLSKAELASAEAALDATISDILLELLTSAADVHLDRKVRAFSQLQSDAITDQLKATARKLEFGESTRTDENLAKARLATAEAGILAATQELNVNGYRFRSISGQSATVVPSLPQLASVPPSLIEAQRIAMDSSPRLRAARLNMEAGKNGVHLAAGALLPQVDAVGGYEYLTGGVANLFTGRLPDDRSALYGGIEVRVPVFQPRDYAELRRARAIRDQRQSQAEVGVRAVTEEVAASWTRWQSAKSIIATAEQAVLSIEKAVDGIKRESIEGNRTLTELLDAQNELLTARITLQRAVRNEFVARAGLLAATTGLKPESILPTGVWQPGSSVGQDVPSFRPAVSELGVTAIPDPLAMPNQAAASSSRPEAARPGGDIVALAKPEEQTAGTSARPAVATLGQVRHPK